MEGATMGMEVLRVALLGAAAVAVVSGLACSPARRFGYATVQSRALGRPMHLGLYTPPGWSGEAPLPLVVFLHGAGDDERVLDRPAITDELDRWVVEGSLPPLAMVVPEGEMGFWRDWEDGTEHYERYVIEDVIEAARELLPVTGERASTHLVGVSMGGTGALAVALNNRDRFASASVISAPVFDARGFRRFLDSVMWRALFPLERIYGSPDAERIERESAFTRLSGEEDLDGLRLLLAAGSRDMREAREGTDLLHRHLEDRGVPHDYLRYRGGHTWTAWRRVLPAALCLQLSEDRSYCRNQASRFMISPADIRADS